MRWLLLNLLLLIIVLFAGYFSRLLRHIKRGWVVNLILLVVIMLVKISLAAIYIVLNIFLIHHWFIYLGINVNTSLFNELGLLLHFRHLLIVVLGIHYYRFVFSMLNSEILVLVTIHLHRGLSDVRLGFIWQWTYHVLLLLYLKLALALFNVIIILNLLRLCILTFILVHYFALFQLVLNILNLNLIYKCLDLPFEFMKFIFQGVLFSLEFVYLIGKLPSNCNSIQHYWNSYS